MRNGRVERTKLPYDHVNCTDEDYGEYRGVYNGKYTFVQCKKSCIQQTMLKKCGCISKFML